MTDKIAFAGPFGIVAMIAAERLNVYLGIVIGGLTVLILLPKAIARSRETVRVVFGILKRRDADRVELSARRRERPQKPREPLP